jgi:hypothetical protein
MSENNTNDNVKLFILDPLSVIIKLAIISNKPVGTKIMIQNNVVFLQEPGIFQAFCRYVLNTNKCDLQYMYNPIHAACQHFLKKEYIDATPRIKSLFKCAQLGIEKLKETYKDYSTICLSLNYFYIIINNFVEQIYNENIFCKDNMTILYNNEVIEKLNSQWTKEKIKVILDLISFLTNDKLASNNVKSVENIMSNIDTETRDLIKSM